MQTKQNIHLEFYKFDNEGVIEICEPLKYNRIDSCDLLLCRIPPGRKSPLRDRALPADLSLDRRLALDVGNRHLSMDLASLYFVTGSSSVNSRLVNAPEFEQQVPKVDKVREPRFQNGVLRTNCIDCLDRTNVAQYAYGLEALGRQLQTVGLIDSPKIDPDSGVAAALMDMYQNMGDSLALQYGGSEAHNYVRSSFTWEIYYFASASCDFKMTNGIH